ncbi:enoyl-CoA hydratase/isomerase family protein [Euzebya pacifica]|uniref:enoyl-CoA hydratase/isomerase family protein n=1 Tax=Euzebya pacifica TaxID=1608957 RepID=UPI001C1FBF9D|nr:enoyl-CoA hydratase/isomerase family protein [Euzebya pacifica]
MTISLERQGSTAVVWLNRPEVHNAISYQLADDLVEAMEDLAADDTTHAVVLAGKGRSFCAGADLAEARQVDGVAAAVEFLRRMRRVFDAVAGSPLPTVAAVHGIALGGGCELAAACDFRLMDQDAKIGLPELKVGALPAGGGMSRLVSLIGLPHAKQMVLTAEPVSAVRAKEMGLATDVIDSGVGVAAAAVAFSERFASLPPAIVRMAKSALNTNARTDAMAAAEIELMSTAAAFGTKDRAEGMSAFLEKRRPLFNGN